VDVELADDRLARNLGLILLIDVGFVEFAATAGTGIGQLRFVNFVDLVGRWRGPMTMPTVVLAALASWRFGMLLWRALGKRCRLTLGGSLALLEQALKLLDLGLEFRDPLPQRSAFRTSFRHAGA
jgi:hypothetical protein